MTLIEEIEARVRPTICETHSVTIDGIGVARTEGRISLVDFDALLAAARMTSPAVWLRQEQRDGHMYAVVLVEVGKRWIEVCAEMEGGPYSHIVESGGIASRVASALEASVQP